MTVQQTILCIEDEDDLRSDIAEELASADYRVLQASDGKEALAMLSQHRPDLVLCDWNMTEMNGIQLLTELRKQGNGVKFGFITSEASPEMKNLAVEAGALFLITKPFTVETFQQMLSPVVS